MEHEYEIDETPQSINRESIGTLMYGVCGRVTGKRCGHGKCKMLNGTQRTETVVSSLGL
jgi:hypothetical protein